MKNRQFGIEKFIWEGRDSKGHISENMDLSDKFCSRPFDAMSIHKNIVTPCCLNWLKIRPTHDYANGEQLMECWNSEAMQAIRASILEGSFKLCNQATCHVIQRGELQKKSEITDPRLRDIISHNSTELSEPPRDFALSYDSSCNLVCPSCRTEKKNYTSGKYFDEAQAIQNQFIKDILSTPTERKFHIKVTGSGDAIGSKIFRQLLTQIDGKEFPNLRITLHTNGVLLTPKWWDKLNKIHGNIQNIEISMDASTPQTYEKLRVGGCWETLLANVDHLCQQKAPVVIGMVVQKENFREMPDFVKLGLSLGVKKIKFALLLNWNTWESEEYENNCIWKSYHPDSRSFFEILKHPVFDAARIDWTNVSKYRKHAIEQPKVIGVVEKQTI